MQNDVTGCVIFIFNIIQYLDLFLVPYLRRFVKNIFTNLKDYILINNFIFSSSGNMQWMFTETQSHHGKSMKNFLKQIHFRLEFCLKHLVFVFCSAQFNIFFYFLETSYFAQPQ